MTGRVWPSSGPLDAGMESLEDGSTGRGDGSAGSGEAGTNLDGSTGTDAAWLDGASLDATSSADAQAATDGNVARDGGDLDIDAEVSLDGGWSVDSSVGLDSAVPTDAAADAAADAVADANADQDAASDSSTPEPCRDSVWDGDRPISGGALIINEIVCYPQQDFSHSDTGRDRFTATPGNGLVSSTDQYVELYNSGSLALDVTGFHLDVYDQSFNTSVFDLSLPRSEVFTFSAGSSLTALLPGGYMLVGNPSGFLSTDAYYVLRSRCNALLDAVEVGGLSEWRDMKQDGVDNGAPAPGANGRSHGRFDEAIARLPDGSDTDDDITDFTAMFATPLRPNVPPPVDLTDVTPPSVVAWETSSRFAVSGKLRVSLDEALNGPSALHAAVVLADGVPVLLGPADLEDDDHTILITPVGRLPFASNIEVTVFGGPDGVRDRAGNPLPADHTFSFQTEPPPGPSASTVINEVVSDPKLDYASWGFAGQTQDISVSSDDEWIELFKRGPGLDDLRDYELVIFSGPNTTSPSWATFTLQQAANLSTSVVRVFGAGSDLSGVAQGDYVVIGNPPGSIPKDVYLELRDPAGGLVDAVEIGGNGTMSDRGGDGIDNGAPGPGQDGSAIDETDEAIARVPDGMDTDDDVADFCRAPATLGSPNNLPCTSGPP